MAKKDLEGCHTLYKRSYLNINISVELLETKKYFIGGNMWYNITTLIKKDSIVVNVLASRDKGD